MLQVLERAAQLYSSQHLQACKVVACQHLLTSTHLMFQRFIEKGIRPDAIAVIGKCYSSDSSVIEAMRRDGITVSDASTMFNSERDFDSQHKENVKQFFSEELHKASLSGIQKVILLDDGGQLLRCANEVDSDIQFVAVEQTSAGYQKIKNTRLNFPVVNVARSEVKLTLESPLIANVFLRELMRLSHDYQGARCLVLGKVQLVIISEPC